MPERHDPYVSLRNPSFLWYLASVVVLTLGTMIQATVVAWVQTISAIVLLAYTLRPEVLADGSGCHCCCWRSAGWSTRSAW